MPSFTILCPQCNAALRSARPLSQDRMVRCPQCGQHFTAPEDDFTAAENDVVPPVARRPNSSKLKTGMIAFGSLGLLVLFLAGGIGLGIVSSNGEKREAAEAERRATEERFAAMQKKIDQQREEIDRERRRREAALRDMQAKAKTRDEKPSETPKAAVSPAAPPPPEPKPAADQAESKIRADYEAHMDAGRAAMVAERYADALSEYKAALLLLPGDAAATRGQRDAEDRLVAIQGKVTRRSDVARLVDKARNALKAKHYDEALAAANEALGLDPRDTEAKQLQRDATSARRAAKGEFAQLMSMAADAQAAGRFEEASRLYARALEIFPDSDNARLGKRLADGAAQDTQAGLAAYFRFMVAGTLAMQNLQFVDAARAFTEALRLVPTDLAAARGLRDARIAVTGVLTVQVNYYRQLQIGYAALQAQRPAAAITAFQAALTIIPNSPLALAGLQQAQSMNK
jgi:tetratricopeptide (TPR) repeat protein